MTKKPYPIHVHDSQRLQIEAVKADLLGLASNTGIIRAALELGLPLLAAMPQAERAALIAKS